MSTLFRKPMENYMGCHIGCAPGTHLKLAELVTAHLAPSSGVLDIGTHSGALLRRLQDAVIADENVFAVLVDAVRCCSLGQITEALFEVGGKYRRSM